MKAATDLVAVVSQYTQGKQVGRRFVALCPFHAEKSASFSVNREDGLYFCFGCQKSGDAISFVREIEHLDFVGAVEWLAVRNGITLRYTDTGEGETRKKRQRLHDADGAGRRLVPRPAADVARRRRGAVVPAQPRLRRRDGAPLPARVGAERVGRARARPAAARGRPGGDRARVPEPQRPRHRRLPRARAVPDLRRRRQGGRPRRPGAARRRRAEVQELAGDAALREEPGALRPQLAQGRHREGGHRPARRSCARATPT